MSSCRQPFELMLLQMSNLDANMNELRGGLSKWGKQADRKPSRQQSSIETEQAQLAYTTAADSLAELEVRCCHLSLYVCVTAPLISRLCSALCGCPSQTWACRPVVSYDKLLLQSCTSNRK